MAVYVSVMTLIVIIQTCPNQKIPLCGALPPFAMYNMAVYLSVMTIERRRRRSAFIFLIVTAIERINYDALGT